MQNIHAHAFDAALHLTPETVREADLSRGYPLDLTVKAGEFDADMAPFEKVLVFGMKARLTGWWVPDEYIANFVARKPGRYVGFAGCDPTRPGHMEELRHAIETLKLSGLKLGPIYAGFDPRDPICDPIYQYCQERDLPVLLHTGTTFNRAAPLEYGRPGLLDDVAIRYPGLRLVLAHCGHPWCEECLVTIRKHKHMYADISALYYRPWQFYNMLITAQEYGVDHKLLFGTDYPFAGARDSIAGLRDVNLVTGSSSLPEVREDLIEGILQRDAFTLLGIDA
jgi:predicted TIM-barrel fold metal-dependent hydrolase